MYLPPPPKKRKKQSITFEIVLVNEENDYGQICVCSNFLIDCSQNSIRKLG